MKYYNTKTQAVIETACELKGGDWVEEGKEQPKNPTNAQPRKTRKKSGD